MEAGLVEKWHAIYGDLNLWDFFVMNSYLKYKNQVNQKVKDYYERQATLKKQKTIE